MASADQLQEKIQGLLEEHIDHERFEDWFLSNFWNAHLWADAETVILAHSLEGLLLDFSSEAIDEPTFRKRLMEISLPFADSNSFGAPSSSPVSKYNALVASNSVNVAA